MTSNFNYQDINVINNVTIKKITIIRQTENFSNVLLFLLNAKQTLIILSTTTIHAHTFIIISNVSNTIPSYLFHVTRGILRKTSNPIQFSPYMVFCLYWNNNFEYNYLQNSYKTLPPHPQI